MTACGEIAMLPSPSDSEERTEPALPKQVQLFIDGGRQPLEQLVNVYVGEIVFLEAKGQDLEAKVLWSSLDTDFGIFPRPGELHLRQAGEFEIRVRAGNNEETVRVRVGEERPDFLFPPGTGPERGETDPTPSSEPENSPDPTPTPQTTASPHPQPVPSDSPLPTALPSDPFMDEVVSFTPGPYAGFGSDNFPQIVLGPPRGGGGFQGGQHVLSLGVGGEIILKSETPILNGDGVDFIVFENPFWIGGNPETPFAELGEISVSQDGENFIGFFCDQANQAELYPGCAGVGAVFANSETNEVDPTDPESSGGDSFDIGELGLPWVRYIKIHDLSSSGSGNSAGFDLDAIAIVYQ